MRSYVHLSCSLGFEEGANSEGREYLAALKDINEPNLVKFTA